MHVTARATPTALCMESGQPHPQVIVASRVAEHRVAAFDQRRDIAGQATPRRRHAQHGIGKARMGAEREQCRAMGGDVVMVVEGVEGAQQIPRLRQRAGRRRVEKAEFIRAPHFHFQHQR